MHSQQHDGDTDNREWIEQAQIDLAMLFATDLHVGSERLYKIKRKGTSLNLLYEVDGELHQRNYLSALSASRKRAKSPSSLFSRSGKMPYAAFCAFVSPSGP